MIHVCITTPFILPAAIACRSNDTHDAPGPPAPASAADAAAAPPPEVKSGRMYKGWVFRVPRVDFVLLSLSLSLSPSLPKLREGRRQKRRASERPARARARPAISISCCQRILGY